MDDRKLDQLMIDLDRHFAEIRDELQRCTNYIVLTIALMLCGSMAIVSIFMWGR